MNYDRLSDILGHEFHDWLQQADILVLGVRGHISCNSLIFLVPIAVLKQDVLDILWEPFGKHLVSADKKWLRGRP